MSNVDISSLKSASKWSAGVVTFRTDLTSWSYDSTSRPDITVNPAANPLETNDATRLSSAMQLWENVVKIDFQTTTAAAPNVVFRETDTLTIDGDPAFAYVLNQSVVNSYLQHIDVIIDSDQFSQPAGSEEFHTLVHELGHVLGLEDIKAGGVLSNREHTVMASVDSNIPFGPMIYDIQALHEMYPSLINRDYNNTSTIYDSSIITGQTKLWTLWDGGGLNDRIDMATQTTAVLLDLRGGADDDGAARFSQVGNERFAIAFDAANASGVVDIERGYGGSAGDTIIGGYVANDIRGNGGADSLYGQEGNDTLLGGAGNDTIRSVLPDGENTVVSGNDSVDGGTNDDLILAAEGNDTLLGGAGIDNISGADGNDSINGGTEGDQIYGDSGSDTLLGDAGNDFIIGDMGNDSIDGGAGNDELYGDDGIDTILGGADNDTIYGHQDGQFESLFGGEGDDLIIAGLGDTVFGGGGNDTIIIHGDETAELYETEYTYVEYSTGTDKVVVEAGSGAVISEGNSIENADNDELWLGNQNISALIVGWFPSVSPVGQGYYAGYGEIDDEGTISFSISDYEGGTGTLIGNAQFDWVISDDDYNAPPNQIQAYQPYVVPGFKTGGAGADTLGGSSGNDNLSGMAGDDSLNGGAGNDHLTGGKGADTLNGSTGDDVLDSDATNDTVGGADLLYGGDGNDRITSGAGNDNINAGEGHDVARADAGNDTLRGYGGDDSLDGGDGDDRFYGGLNNDLLRGNAGLDTISGEEGDDLLKGELGNDSLFGDAGNDTAYGGDGNDKAYGSLGLDRLYGGAGNDSLFGEEDADKLGGDAGLDSLDGGLGNDTILGGDDADTLLGADGDDQLLGDAGNDTITGGNGNDLIYGGIGNDTVDGQANNDVIYGGDGNDSLTGNTGDDTILGGVGQDTIISGTGLDVIMFQSILDSYDSGTTLVLDRINDFTDGSDKLDVSALGYTGIQAGGGSGTTLGFVYSSTSNRTYVTAADTDFKFYLVGNITLDAGDFIFDPLG